MQLERDRGTRAVESLRRFPATRCARHSRRRPPRGMPSALGDVGCLGSAFGRTICARSRLWPAGARRRRSTATHCEAGKRADRFIAASSFCAIRVVPNYHCRCMPRWLSTGSSLLAAGAEGYERSELSRRAESAPRAGRPQATSCQVRQKPDTISMCTRGSPEGGRYDYFLSNQRVS